jgi:hypothetical protein
MDFTKIINKSFEVAWRYKSLWVLGLFAGGGTVAFNWPGDLGDKLDMEDLPWDLSDFSFPPEAVLPIIIWLGMLVLLLVLMHFIAVPALIDGVNKITRGGTYSLGGSISAGLHFFFRFLGLGLLTFFVVVAVITVMVLVVVLFFKMHWVFGVMSLLVFIPVGICLIVISNNIYSLAQRAMVVRDVSIGDGLDEGYRLFRYNIGSNILIFLIDVGLSIGFGILMLILWAVFGIPIGAAVLALGLGWVAAIFLAIILGLPISLIAGGFFGAVLTNIYTLFYFELLEPSVTRVENPPPAAMAGP